ncbi:helix-turn-helix domain-containing protein (plasmid) [Erwinia pyri]|uniref:Helix-turn-helix domain-containing protein n=1 Tax=Erwinia pyri TaxID=3062598 RepID=A0AA50DPL0_9GAMM|nr:helix-turn-helix domain-containing protein [Erwinia sp. DE2]WLS81062.1 helix-turn-helix domain-containing protein [Erwinia sp. DE2]
MSLKMRKKVEPLPGCPMSKCTALLGGLWTPELIWSLSNGPRRFSELRRDTPTISAKVLSGRLRELEGRGVIRRNVLATSPPSVEYELTSLGQELLPVITSIVEVGSRLLLRDAARET